LGKDGLPSKEAARPYLKKYVKALVELFEKHKLEVGYPADRKLVVEAPFSLDDDGEDAEQPEAKSGKAKKDD